MSRQTMTDQMLEWSIQHHEATGEKRFKLDRKFRRAAAQHYSGVFWLAGHYIHLIPPHALMPYMDYEIQIESEATNE